MTLHAITAGCSRPRLSMKKHWHVLLFSLAASVMSLPALAGSVAYSYDPLGRLLKASYSNGVVITYAYDAAGNRTSTVTAGVPAAKAIK